MRVFWGIREWVGAIVELPVQGPLPCRTVLVPNERVAHALRRELIRTGHAEVLAGTRFIVPIHAAIEVLRLGGIAFNPGEEQLRPIRIGILFRGALPLHYFSTELLRTTLGWDEAFARTIGDLENAGLSPDDLSVSGDPRVQDVATIWRASQESAGTSWASGRIFAEAARLLEAQSTVWPFDGQVLAAVSAEQPTAQARFVRAIPDATLAIFAARPVRTHYLERLRRLHGEAAADAVANAEAERHATDERAILASFLFERPDVLADPDRPRSRGIDGTAHLEEHAGLEAELEAAADWVAQEVLERGTPLEDIAVLMPILDPVAGMLAERLARLGSDGSGLSAYVAGGVPVISTSGGARVRAVIHALRSGLGADTLAEVLPALRTSDAEKRHLSRGAAMDLVYSLGTVGGSPTNLKGALEWSARADARQSKMESWLARAAGVEDVEEQAGLARSKRDVERLAADLRVIRPALDALVDVAREVAADAPLPSLWKALHAFMEKWLLGPGSGAPVWRLLDEALAPACSDARCGDLSGDAALELTEKMLASLRIRTGRFGDPAVYIGTIRDAAGIPFRAVRVIGLAEGALPSSPREDPVLPEELRQHLSQGLTPTTGDHALADLHALDRVVGDVTGALVLSAPRLSAERTDREPSSIFIEAAAALGRLNSETGARGPVIRDRTALERDAFAPARAALRDFRLGTPVSAAAWLDRTARLQRDVPSSWLGGGHLDLDRIDALAFSESWNGLDGLLGDTGLVPPGLSPDTPISASGLRTLLQCPHLFLFERLLSWYEPAAAPPLREIDTLSYGGLFHRVAEAFFREHGERFAARQMSLPHWRNVGDELVDTLFSEFCEEYPLLGDAVRDQQRQRLRRSFGTFLEYDWRDGLPQRFFGVERSFGSTAGVEIALNEGPVYLRGFIDRIDVEGQRAVVRDLKTGRAHPRIGPEQDPHPYLDVQLALYGLVARQLAAEWGIPTRISAAYAYAEHSGEPERRFRDDFGVLEEQARKWLGVARRLLEERAFPRTPVYDDCSYCAFQVVCGLPGRMRAEELLVNTAGGALGAFRDLKAGPQI